MNITDIITLGANPDRKKRFRKGRGLGSGNGKTAGRGSKGLGSRSGANFLRGYVGGQTPLLARIPKRGFNNINFRQKTVVVTIEDDCNIPAIEDIERGTVLKIILGKKGLTKAIKVSAHKFSASAKDAIEKAGGQVIVVESSPKWTRTSKKKA